MRAILIQTGETESPRWQRLCGLLGMSSPGEQCQAFGHLVKWFLRWAGQPELDAVMFTSNKCLEAMPGLGFTVARISSLQAAAGNAGSWSFDFADIYQHTLRPDSGGSFRFTPPAQGSLPPKRPVTCAPFRSEMPGARTARL